jgi:hypothetical protein
MGSYVPVKVKDCGVVPFCRDLFVFARVTEVEVVASSGRVGRGEKRNVMYQTNDTLAGRSLACLLQVCFN